MAALELQPGERIVSVSAGGGGYGDPLTRDPAAVLHDVLEGWVSRERALEVYGVVLTDSGEEVTPPQPRQSARQPEPPNPRRFHESGSDPARRGLTPGGGA